MRSLFSLPAVAALLAPFGVAVPHPSGASVAAQEPMSSAAELATARREIKVLTYALHMNQVQRAVEERELQEAEHLLQRYIPKSGEDDLRGFEWHYWHRQIHGELWSISTGEVNRVAASPDGKLVAVVCARYEDKPVIRDGQKVILRRATGSGKLLDAATGNVKADLPSDLAECGSLAFSPDGAYLAAGDFAGGTIKVIKAATGARAATLKDHHEKSDVSSLVFLADGKTLVSASADHTLRFWKWHEEELAETLQLPGVGQSLALSPDGKHLAVAYGYEYAEGSDAGVRILELTTKKLVLDQKLERREARQAVYFNDNGKQLIELESSGRVMTRNVAGGEIAKTFNVIGDTKKHLLAQAFSPDRKTLATSIDPDVILWDVATGKKKHTLKGQVHDSRTRLAFSAEGTKLVIGYPSSVKSWLLNEVPNPRIVRLPAKLSHGRAALSPDGKFVACGGSGAETSTVWSLATPEPVFEIGGADIRQLAFSPDSKLLVSAEYEQVRLWDIAKREVTRTVPIKGLNCEATFSPTGRLLAIRTDTEITLLDIERGSTSRHALDPKEHVAGLAFSPNEKLLASVDFDATVRLWEVEKPETKRVITIGASAAFISFLDDGHKLGLLSRDGLVVWDLDKNLRASSASRTLSQASGWLAISADGKTATVGTTWKDYVVLLNLATVQPVARLRLKGDSQVRFLQFAKDGNSLSAATSDDSSDITVYTWTISDG